MLPITPDELRRWRAEVELGAEFRDKEFGTYQQQQPGSAPKTSGAGLNIEAFEQGAREDSGGLSTAPLNLIFPIVRTILPTLFYQRPRVNAVPDARSTEAADDAFYAAEIINKDIRNPDMRLKETGNLIVFDGVVPGVAFAKIGYATEFGPDILPTKAETRKGFVDRMKQQVNDLAVSVGLVAPKTDDPEPEKVQEDLTIRSESGYIQWISPFDMAIDPRAHDLTDALWIGQCQRRTIGAIKRDRRYSKARLELVGDPIEESRIPDSFIEEFQTAEVWEVHYKDLASPTGITVLTFAKTQQMTKALMHEHNAYDFGGWQYDWLAPNKHGHRLWAISSISVCRPLLDRINSSFDALLEQLDKFVVKVVHNDKVSPDGQKALLSSTIGAVVKIDGDTDVRSAVGMVNMEQLNPEIVRFLDYCIDFIILIVGLTRAQLTGLTTAQTATEANIGQGGSQTRRTDEGNLVGDFFNRVITKYWRCKAQFADLTEIDIVQQTGIPDPQTGMETTSWYPPIDQARAERLKRTKFQLSLELGSIQKPNLEIVRAQFENFVRVLMEPAVTQGLGLEGKRLSAEAVIREYTKFFTEYGMARLEKIIVPVVDPMLQQALQNYTGKPGESSPNGNGGMQPPSYSNLIAGAAGEKGQGAPRI